MERRIGDFHVERKPAAINRVAPRSSQVLARSRFFSLQIVLALRFRVGDPQLVNGAGIQLPLALLSGADRRFTLCPLFR